MSVSAAASSRAETARLSVPVVLGLIVCAATALHVLLALQIPSPWAFPDELRYSELAKSLAHGDLPSIRDRVRFDFGLGYPLVVAPAWWLFEDVTKAYVAAKVINSFVLALTAIPAYFLARRFVAERVAVVAAALCVAIPPLLFAGLLMTEVALYPLFVLALLAIAVALERPTTATQAAALGVVGLAATVKVLALTLVIAFVGAAVLYSWLETRDVREWGTRLRRYAPTFIAVAVIALLGSVAGLVAGKSPTAALGAYDWVLGSARLAQLPAWMFFHVAAFDLYVAVIPFIAACLFVVYGFRRGAERRARLLAVLLVTASVPVFAAVAAYSSNSGDSDLGYATGAGAHERATFILEPLYLIAFVAWVSGRPGSRRLVAVVAVVAAVLPALIPLDRFEQNEVSVHAFSLVPWVSAERHGLWPFGLLVVTGSLSAAFVWFTRARARSAAYLAPVFAAFVVVTLIAQSVIEVSSEETRAAGYGDTPRWIDRAVGDAADVSVLWYEPPGGSSTRGAGRHRIVWVNEFFNRSVGEVYELGSAQPFAVDLEATPVRLAKNGRVLLDQGTPARLGRLVLAPCFVRVDGVPIARDPATEATVYRVGSRVRARVLPPVNQSGRC